MLKSRLFPLVLATGLALTTSASADPMLDFFKGKSTATASFKAINGVNRNFTVKLNGRAHGKTLNLVEDFTFEDGERSRKTWRFTKTAENRYTGTREDVIGTTTVRINGNIAKFTYLVDLDEGPGENIVRFYDTIRFATGGKSALNTAIVTKYGLPVAKVRVDFRK